MVKNLRVIHHERLDAGGQWMATHWGRDRHVAVSAQSTLLGNLNTGVASDLERTQDAVTAPEIIEERKPSIDVAQALNMTVPGIVAHQSALKGGELLKIPQYRF